ncbi:MAG TPA: SRPBCC domain-containing protein [Gemmatimonadaceae bacterium]|nr:SRPBCC domain-containing protein [Gemmatimonadaceae bacterium]
MTGAITPPYMVLSPDHGLVITRTFEVPRALMFKAWTEPEHLVHWWGQPRGATMPFCTVDLRSGGLFRFCVKTADGGTLWGRGIYREIAEPERLVFDMAITDESGHVIEPPTGMPGEQRITVSFTEHDGGTTLTIVHAGVEQASTDNQTNYQLGWDESLDRLAERVASVASTITPSRAEHSPFASGVRAGNVATDSTSAAADPEIVTTRVFDARRDLVFRAWTEPEHVVRWWGPDGFTTTIHQMDVRPGGEWRFIMHGPDGVDYRNEIVFVEVAPPERLVYDHGPTPKFRTTVTFSDDSGKTRLTMRMVFMTAADYERAITVFHADQGSEQTLARLGVYLSEMESA